MTDEPSREARIARVFVELTDTLVEDFDVIDLLTIVTTSCVDVLGADAAGLLLATGNGELKLVASSSDEVQLVELIALQAQEGACYEAFHSGTSVGAADLQDELRRWPLFAAAALAMNFRSVHSLPLRTRGGLIGVLGMFDCEVDGFSPDDLVVAQSFADVATLTVLQHRAVVEQQAVTNQLADALNSRVVIEQAKGVIAGQTGWPMEKAFDALRRYARGNRHKLVDVAASIIDGRIKVEDLD
ncbi:MAG TPA: GAF and ANTAR domain-containing protein [Acidimicrobiales bacterium]|nr:GAF and ANTAR domain-containing protein [Acidimicrobiales bacterium]